MVVRDSADAPWRVLGRATANANAPVEVEVDVVGASEPVTGRKRALSGSADVGEGSTKRARTEPSDSEDAAPEPATSNTNGHSSAPPCLTPPPDPTAQSIFAHLDESDTSLGAGDIFLSGSNWRARWCRCPRCMVELSKDGYLLEEEETYEPPEDPDSGLSIEQLGMQALGRLPRDKVIDGIRAFNDMRYRSVLHWIARVWFTDDICRDDLMSYLRPFAAQGKAVGEEDINRFFEARKSGRT